MGCCPGRVPEAMLLAGARESAERAALPTVAGRAAVRIVIGQTTSAMARALRPAGALCAVDCHETRPRLPLWALPPAPGQGLESSVLQPPRRSHPQRAHSRGRRVCYRRWRHSKQTRPALFASSPAALLRASDGSTLTWRSRWAAEQCPALFLCRARPMARTLLPLSAPEFESWRSAAQRSACWPGLPHLRPRGPGPAGLRQPAAVTR